MSKDSMNIKRVFFIMLMVLCQHSLVKSQVSIESLPSYLNTSNAGTEFYITTIPYYYEDFGTYHYKRIHVFCDQVTEVIIENFSNGTSRSVFTNPNAVTIIDLYEIDQNYRKYFNSNGENVAEKVFNNLSVRITSKSPIVLSFSSIDTYTGESYLVLPVSSWGREYVVNSFNSKYNYGNSYNLQSIVSIVAAFDNTRVFFTLVGDGITETIGGQKIGETKQYNLNRGDVLPISSLGEKGTSMTASLVQSTKPVGVVSGHQRAYIPLEVSNTNLIMEMELPVFTWGKEFHIPKNYGRKIGYIFQVVAKEPNTTIFINGEEVKNLGSKLQTTSAEWGEFNLDKVFWNNSDVNNVVTADKPISITVFNQNSVVDSTNQTSFQMSLSPITQYRNHIVFSTILLILNYSNLMNVIVPLDENNKIPLDVEWGEMVDDTIQWTPFTDKWGDSVQTYYGTQNGKKYGIANIEFNKEGNYQIRAKNPLMAYLYGQTTTESFGFPAFVGLKDVSKIDTVPPKFNFLVNNYVGEVTGPNGIGLPTIQEMPEDGDRRTNLGFVFERTEYTVNFELPLVEFVPGEDRIITFQPNIIDKSKDAQLVITAIDRAGNDTTVVLTYKPFNTTVFEELSNKFLKVTPSITNNSPISIELSNAGESLSIVSITGKTVYTFDNVKLANASQTLQFDIAELPIGMYYVVYSVEGKHYQQSFVKVK